MASLFLMVGTVWAQIPEASPAPAGGQWHANTKWYTIQCNDDSKGYISLQHADVKGNLMLNKKTKPAGAEGLWCVVGDDANGYQFYNCASGATKVLGATGSDGGGRMKMYDASSTETGVTYKFNIKKLEGQDGYAFVQQYGATNQWWNNRDKYLSYWNNSAAYATNCTGSQYKFVEVTSEELKTLAESYKTSALAVLNSLEGLFDDDAAIIKAAIESVNTDDAAALGTIISEFEKIGNKRIAFRNGDPNHQNRVNAYLAVRPNREKGYGTQAHQNWGNIVWSLKLGNNSTFALYNEVHELYLGSPSSEGALTAVPTAGYTVELIDATSNKVEFKWGGETLHLNNHNDGFLSSYDYNDNASRWYIETDLSGRLAEYKTAIAGLIADATTLAADTRLKESKELANLNAAIEKVNSGDDLVPVVKTVSELPSLMDAANVYIRETDVTYITALNFTENSNHPIIVNNKRSNWGVDANSTALSTLAKLGLAKSSIDTKQQFAIITPDNGANYYLYSVHAQRYLKSDNTFSTQGEPIAFADASSRGENKVQVRFRDVAQKYFNVGGSNQMEINWYNTIDDGNACEMVQYNTLEFDLDYALRVLKEGAKTTVKYMLGEEQVFLQDELLFVGDTKTLSLYGAKITSATVNGTPLTAPSDNANWKYTVDEVGPKEIIVNIEKETCWFELQSPASPATYFNFTAKTVDGLETIASFQTTPSYLTITPSGNGYILKNKDDETVAIGSTHNWCVTNHESLWLISEADENGLVTISRKDDANKRLGSDSNTNVGTAIFTNVGSGCNKWKLIPVYPVTINYVCGDKVIDPIEDIVIAGASFTAEINTFNGTLVSCVDDQGAPIEVSEDNIIFISEVNAPTTITVTLEGAMEPGTLEIGNWVVSYEPATNGIKLKGATIIDENGSGVLEIPSTCTIGGKPQNVVAISPDFLHDNTDVTSVELPSTLTNLGFRKVEPMFVGSYEGQPGDYGVFDGPTLVEGQGHNRCYIFPNDPHTGEPYVVNEKSAWRLTLDVTITDPNANFNNYGSSIVSTHENSLADSYVGYMQIYMNSGHKNLTVKIDNADDRYRYTLPDGYNNHFKFELEHDGTGGYQVVIYYDDGTAKMYNISASANNTVKDFDRLYYSLPEGIHVDVKFDRLISEGLFVGCTKLTEIIVDENNPTFKSCDHGVLYDKNGYYVMRIPEGETEHHFEIPSKVVKLYAGAVHGVNADIVLHSNPDIGKVEGHDEHVKNAKFYLSLDDIDATITEKETGYGGARDFISTNINTYQSANYKRAPLAKGVYGTICLPFVPTNAMEKYDFFKFKSGDATSLTFSQVTELEANEPYLYKLKENPGDMDQDKDGKDVFKSKSGEIVTIVTKDKYDPKQHKAGTYDALGSFVNFYVETKNYPNSAFYYYSLGQEKFLKVTQKLTYRPYRAFFVVTPKKEEGGASQAPARLSLRLLDGTTTDIDASLVEGMETPVYYDLSGRRVLNPGSGVYIVNGKKVFIK